MSELSVRETAARALFGKRWTGMTFGRHPDLEDECREVATAVLAAVADHGGLADALRGHLLRWHRASGQAACARQGCGFEVRGVGGESDLFTAEAAHLADVVRAWMVQP